jgi:hypothetical protein
LATRGIEEAMETLMQTKPIYFEKSKYMNDDMMHSRISIMKIWDVTLPLSIGVFGASSRLLWA